MKTGVLCVLIGCSTSLLSAANPASADSMMEAVRLGDMDRVQTLLADGASPDRDPNATWSGSPLFHALQTRRFEIARRLIEAGANVREPEDAGIPLEWAARAGDASIVRLMLAKGARADVRKINVVGAPTTPMDTAVEWGRLEVIRALEDAGVSVLGADRGALALRIVGLGGYVDCAEYLLDRGARVDARHDGNTALDGAVLQNNLGMIKLLLSRGADINGISDGAPIGDWGNYRRTPVVMAVLASQREALALLLQHGADARALDNLAMKWADLLGDEEAWRLLKAAGAPEPKPFSFRDWAGSSFLRKGSAPAARGTSESNMTSAEWLAAAPAGDVAVFARPTRFAVIPLDKGLADAEAILSAKLSTLEKATVLERVELDALRKERALNETVGRAPEANREIGRLLGADALVLLQSYRLGETTVIQARIVSVATGLVTAVVPWAREKNDLESWAGALADRCAAEGERIHVSPTEARLVAVSPFTASLNTPAARKAERQLTVAVALRLARLPGVFLVEREVLERLRVEDRDESRALLGGSWLIHGAVETSLNDDGVTVSLTASSGGNASPRELRVDGRAGDPTTMAETVGRELAPLFATEGGERWTPLAEAEQWLAQGRAFLARRMWEQADAAGEAAWVLGLRDDRVRRLRVETITGRLTFYGELLPGVKRSRMDLRGAEDLLTYRAPLLLPPDGPREPDAEEYVEQAHVLLDLFEPTLDASRKDVGGKRFTDWAGGPVWDAATLALRLAQPLSYRREGLELKALGKRLIETNDRALALARERDDAMLWHTLVALRCKHLAWWAQEDEAFFQGDVLRLLREVREMPAPYSQHAVWETVHAFAADHMAYVNGSKGQAWVRLARRMAASEDPQERFFGVALLNKEVQGFRMIEHNLDWLMEAFPEMVAQDRAVPALSKLQGYGTGSLRGGYYVKGCWYADVFGEQLTVPSRQRGPQAWWMLRPVGIGGNERGPEIREFYRINSKRRLELVAANGPSGVLSPFGRGSGLSLAELDELIALTKQARERFIADAQIHPGIKAVEKAWKDELRTVAMENDRKALLKIAAPEPAGRLALGPQRILFETELAQLDVKAREGVPPMQELGFFWDGDGRFWFLAGFDHGAVFTFAADGSIATTLRVPAEPNKESRVSLSPYWWPAASIDARYLVGYAREYTRKTETSRPVFLLHDRETGRWETLVSPQPFHRIFDVRLFAGKVYFTFLHNPVIESADPAGYYSRHYENDGDPFNGLMSYDPVARRYDLLVSSRRQPPRSPLDKPSGRYRRLIPLDADTFAVEGLETHVYDARAETWRAAVSEDTRRIRRNRDKRSDDHLHAGGKWWRPAKLENGVIRFTTKGAEVRLQAPWMIDPAVAERLKPYPVLQAQYTDTTPVTRIECVMTRDGLFIRKGAVYHWVPRPEVEAALDVALAQPTPGE